MARYYKYKRYYKKIYPRKRWASNVGTKTTLVTIPSGSTGAHNTFSVCSNSTQASTPTPVIIKFGRFKIKGDVRFTVANASNYASAILYVMFVPQGNTLDIDLVNNHPEYILGWTSISLDSGNTYSLTSTLKRNLNSGDSIQVYIGVNAVNNVQADTSFSFFNTYQFWTTSS